MPGSGSWRSVPPSCASSNSRSSPAPTALIPSSAATCVARTAAHGSRTHARTVRSPSTRAGWSARTARCRSAAPPSRPAASHARSVPGRSERRRGLRRDPSGLPAGPRPLAPRPALRAGRGQPVPPGQASPVPRRRPPSSASPLPPAASRPRTEDATARPTVASARRRRRRASRLQVRLVALRVRPRPIRSDGWIPAPISPKCIHPGSPPRWRGCPTCPTPFALSERTA